MNMRNKNNDRGFVVILALIAIMAMSFFLVTGAATTSSALKISGNYAKTVDSFNVAEIGIAKARPILEANDFDTLLTTYTQADLPLIAQTAFNDGTYEVFVEDDDDGDSNLFNDANDIIVIHSIGRNNSGGKVEIRAHMQKPTATDPEEFPGDPSSGKGAAMTCGPDADIKTQGAAWISGHDYQVPAAGCVGPACGGTDLTAADPATYPGAMAIVSDGNVDLSTKTIISEESPPYAENVTDTNCDEWRTLRDQLAALDPSSEDVYLLDGSTTNSALNDCTDPKVFIINTSATVYHITGDSYICGIIVVASNTVVKTTGNAVIIGTVLIMGDNADLQVEVSTGTPRVFGQVIVESVSTDKAMEIEVQGTAEINFSTEGIGYAEQALNDVLGGGGGGGGGLVTMAWQETY